MDNLTHTLVGVGLAKAGLSRWSKRGTLLLVIASNIPDIDVLFLFPWFQDSFLLRRTITHSIVGIPIIACMATLLFHKKVKESSWGRQFFLVLIGMVGHAFFDLLNSYGVVLWAPLFWKRYELAWVFIIDLALFGILLTPLLISGVLRLAKVHRDLRPLFQTALVITALYIGLCGWGHRTALRLLNNSVAPSLTKADLIMAFPEALGCHRFRGVIKKGNVYDIYAIHVFKKSISKVQTVETAEEDSSIKFARATVRAQRLEWFMKAPVWQKLSGHTCVLYDLRFVSSVLKQSSAFQFEFELPQN